MKLYLIFTNQRFQSICYFLFWAIIFSTIYAQLPLYYSNQNQYFLHGLANGGLGLLKEDWLANTIDPCPVFSLLVTFTYRFLSENLFYFYYTIILGVYLYSIIGIVITPFKIDNSKVKYFTFLTLILIIHSSAFSSLSVRIVGINLSQLLHYGVADQYILGHVFQPSVFGVFLIMSINVFLRGRRYWATFLLVVSATLHPTYLLSAAILTFTYMVIILIEEKSIVKSSLSGLLAFVLVLPILCYVFFAFSPSTPAMLSMARDILVNFRIPHHILQSTSVLGVPFYFQLLIIILAMILIRKTKLFLVLLISISAAFLLTIVEIVSGSHSLVLLFPWRLSVIVIPISTSIIVAHGVTYIFDRFSQYVSNKQLMLRVTSYTIIILLVLTGLYTKSVYFSSADKKNAYIPMLNYVQATKSAGDTYLVPVRPFGEIENFRLYTGAPIFIDYKSIPYKDIELLEWYKRMQIAQDFYSDDSSDCQILEKLADNYGITHFVWGDSQYHVDCGVLTKVYTDEHYKIYRINSHLR